MCFRLSELVLKPPDATVLLVKWLGKRLEACISVAVMHLRVDTHNRWLTNASTLISNDVLAQ